MRFVGGVVLIAAALVCASPQRAEAVTARMSLGANYWFAHQGVFDLSFTAETPLASFISVGGRFGVLLTSEGPKVGIPLDLLVRLHIVSPIYIEVTGGPWIVFNTGDDLRAHFGFGIGLTSGTISFGPEVSYLEPDAMIGVRLAFHL